LERWWPTRLLRVSACLRPLAQKTSRAMAGAARTVGPDSMARNVTAQWTKSASAMVGPMTCRTSFSGDRHEHAQADQRPPPPLAILGRLVATLTTASERAVRRFCRPSRNRVRLSSHSADLLEVPGGFGRPSSSARSGRCLGCLADAGPRLEAPTATYRTCRATVRVRSCAATCRTTATTWWRSRGPTTVPRSTAAPLRCHALRGRRSWFGQARARSRGARRKLHGCVAGRCSWVLWSGSDR